MSSPSIRIVSVFAALVGVGMLLLASTTSTVLLDEYRVYEADGAVVVRWTALDEQNVDMYFVRHRTQNSTSFVNLAEVRPHGPRRPYEYRDTRVFKAGADEVTYKVEARLKNGTRYEFSELSIAYSSTAVRRTWGSIKAMFQ